MEASSVAMDSMDSSVGLKNVSKMDDAPDWVV